MRHLYLLLLLLAFTRVGAQQVVISEPQKLSYKTPNMSIIGKNNDGIIIYKYGRGSDMVEAYSSNMALRWKKNLNIKQENSSILKMVLFPTKTLIFFLSQTKNYSVVYAQKLTSKFVSDGQFTAVDTFTGSRPASEMKVVHSQNRAQVAVYAPNFANGKLTGLQVSGLNGELEIKYHAQITLPEVAANYQLDGIVPDNNGNLSILLESLTRSKKKSTDKEFRTYYYNIATKELKEIPYALSSTIYGNVAMEVDNVNGHVVLAGFFSIDDKKEARGYFMESYDVNTGAMVASTYTEFPMAMLTLITGKDSTRTDKGLYSFHVKELVLRHDGGALLLAESIFESTENVEMPSFGPSVGANIRTVKVTYYNDIMSVSLKPNGTTENYNLLHKKQVSEEDDGFYSSFCLVNTDFKLHFIYNDEIYYKTNVQEYTIDSLGHQDRSLVLNSGERDILLAPNIGKQISANEVVIPSFRKNSVRLVKISL